MRALVKTCRRYARLWRRARSGEEVSTEEKQPLGEDGKKSHD